MKGPRFIVYALVDPRDGTPKYVGQSRNGTKRARAHMMPSSLNKPDNPRKNDWLRELLALGLSPEIRVLANFIDGDPLDLAERKWIAHGWREWNIFNIASGGSSQMLGRHHSPESRRKMSKANTGQKRSPDQISRMSESKKNPSQETRGLISAAAKNRPPKSDEYKRAMSDKLTGRVFSPEHLANLTAANKRRAGRAISDETRRRMSENRQPVSEESRERYRQAARQRWIDRRNKNLPTTAVIV